MGGVRGKLLKFSVLGGFPRVAGKARETYYLIEDH